MSTNFFFLARGRGRPDQPLARSWMRGTWLLDERALLALKRFSPLLLKKHRAQPLWSII